MDKEKSLKGLGLFVENIVHLISIGKSETITDIEQHFEDKDVVEYLYHKYAENFFTQFDNTTYSNENINNYYYNYFGYINGNESRKYGIMKENDGLLLIISLLMDKVERESVNWYNE